MTAPSLVHLLERAARRWPQRAAVISAAGTRSYAELAEAAGTRGRQLREAGGRVAITGHATGDTVAWIWGALLASAPFALLGRHWPAALRDSVLADFDPRGIVDPDWEPRAGASIDGGDGGVASVLYTSGSRGEPKGVAMTAEAMAQSVHSIDAYLRLQAEDRIWGGLPLHYGYGLYQIFLCANAGAALVLPSHPELLGHCLEVLGRHRVSVLPGVPALWSQLLDAESFRHDQFPRLAMLSNAGDHFPRAAIRELRSRFPALRMHAMYGLTEYTRVASLDPDELDTHPDSVGYPIAGCEVRVVDADGQRLPPGEIGELVVRGAHLMLGYWRDPDATAAILRPLHESQEPWLWTGDLFRQDTRGRLYHEGRSDDVFKCRGQKVAPRRVASVLESFAGVLEAAVVPLRGPRDAVSVRAFLRTEGKLDPAALRAHCRSRLAAHEMPTQIDVVADFPRSERGKIDRSALILCPSPEGRTSCP